MTDLRQRIQDQAPSIDAGAGFSTKEGEHPAGPVKHGGFTQGLRMVAFFIYFNIACISMHIGQWCGAPLYFVNRNYYYAWMAWTKQLFALTLNSITDWFSPTLMRISGDASVKGQIHLDKSGRLQTSFPERLIVIANHQIYTDWIYLWWTSYTSNKHGHFYIILKESLKYIPVIGPGMMFYGFIFLARNWLKDKPRFQYHLQKLNSRHSGPLSGTQSLDPMWLLIFPEGTNLCPNGRKASQKWAARQNIPDMVHQLLPRTTGLQFCLEELRNTVDWVYDCTIAYEGIPRGEYGQDIFTLRSTYFQGRAPKSVNMYWRRFSVKTIPFDDSTAFDQWLRDRWTEKDRLLELYMQTGRFPADESGGASSSKYMETSVQSKSLLENMTVFLPLATISVGVFLAHRFGR